MSSGRTVEKTRREKEQERLLSLVAKRPEDDKDFPFTGVLLNDAIRKCVDAFELISPLCEENLKPANYKLRIGDQYALKGEIKSLSDEPGKNKITIEPFDVAVIKTLETINMPRFLIARWNIRVQLAYEGLLWVGGPQVDAGYVGHLFCPIYNLSDKPVTLNYGDPIAVIDFVKTTQFHEGTSMDYPGPLPELILFEDYNPEKLKSALATRVVSQLKDFEGRIKAIETELDERMASVQGRIDNFVSITFAVVGILFAAVTLFFGKSELPNWWDPSVFWVSALAIIIAMFAWLNTRASMQLFRRPWHRILFELVILGILLSSMWGFSTRTHTKVKDLTKQVQQLQDRVDRLGPNTPAGVPANQPQKGQPPAPESDTPKKSRVPQ